MDIQNLENKQTFDILQYVKENLSGLFLLALAFLIIYFVFYIVFLIFFILEIVKIINKAFVEKLWDFLEKFYIA